MMKTWLNNLVAFLNVTGHDLDTWLKWIFSLVIVFHFLNFAGVLWDYSAPRPVLMGFDEDSSFSVETAEKTLPINHNGSTTYGPLYYRLVWPIKDYLTNNFTTQIESSIENKQRNIFFSFLGLNLICLFASCFIAMKLLTSDLRWQLLGSSVLVSSFLHNEYRNLILFMAKPDYLLCFFVSIAAYFTFMYLKSIDSLSHFRKMSFFWACALSTKLVSVLFLPGFVFIFLQKNRVELLQKLLHFSKYLIVFYLVIGFPQNLDFGGYLRYLHQQNGYTSFVTWDFLINNWLPLFWADLSRPLLAIIILSLLVPMRKQFLNQKRVFLFFLFSLLPMILIMLKKIPALYEWYTFPFVHLFLLGLIVLLSYVKEKYLSFVFEWINPQAKSNRILLVLSFIAIPNITSVLPTQFYERYKKQMTCREEIHQVKNILDLKMSEGKKVLSDPGLPYDLKFHNILISPEWQMSTDLLKSPDYSIISLKRSYYVMYLPLSEGGSGSFVGHINSTEKPHQFYRLFMNKTETQDPHGGRWKKFYSDSCTFELWEKL